MNGGAQAIGRSSYTTSKFEKAFQGSRDWQLKGCNQSGCRIPLTQQIGART